MPVRGGIVGLSVRAGWLGVGLVGRVQVGRVGEWVIFREDGVKQVWSGAFRGG